MMKKYYCKECGAEKSAEQETCSSCGSGLTKVKLIISDKLEIHDGGNIKSTKKTGKRKRPEYEQKFGANYSISKEKYVDKTRVINRKDNLYKEKVVDPETDEVIHEKQEKLSDHIGHGSDKFNPPKDD